MYYEGPLRISKTEGLQINVLIVENRAKEPYRVISTSELASRQDDDIDQMREMAHAVLDDEFPSFKSDHPEIYEAFFQ